MDVKYSFDRKKKDLMMYIITYKSHRYTTAQTFSLNRDLIYFLLLSIFPYAESIKEGVVNQGLYRFLYSQKENSLLFIQNKQQEQPNKDKTRKTTTPQQHLSFLFLFFFK